MSPYSGPVFSLVEGDSTKMEERGTLNEGVWDGLHESYYETGQLLGKGSYSNGELDGIWEMYHYDGRVSKGSYSNGDKCGEWIELGETKTYPPCPNG